MVFVSKQGIFQHESRRTDSTLKFSVSNCTPVSSTAVPHYRQALSSLPRAVGLGLRSHNGSRTPTHTQHDVQFLILAPSLWSLQDILEWTSESTAT